MFGASRSIHRAVRIGRPLQHYPRTSPPKRAQEGSIQLFGPFGLDADLDEASGLAQQRNASPRYQGVRILKGHDHAANSLFN
jgi:hypothetical protein